MNLKYQLCQTDQIKLILHTDEQIIAEYLIKIGADVNMKDEKGRTGLHYTTLTGNENLNNLNSIP